MGAVGTGIVLLSRRGLTRLSPGGPRGRCPDAAGARPVRGAGFTGISGNGQKGRLYRPVIGR
ncbi:hypothetical protein GCM10011374_36070 [Kocuria dechangensis]|uniref:Uncharacterized protein n=1 Tax=Kocuria dechangensis TaxID=1176249 RepID=A0A917H5U6_9MICC|nr:hypothetical protein GCM10011374_36070 [Kocuria dechangensis]